MESGIIQLFPAFRGSAETTKEEMAAYIKAAADRFCALMGLAVIEEATVQHDYGAVYVLGEQGEEQGIIAVGNVAAASYYYDRVLISKVGAGNSICVPYTATSYGQYGGVIYSVSATISIYMKYKKDQDTAIFCMGTGTTASISYNNGCFCITQFRYGGVEKKNFMVCYGNLFYTSYNSILGNETDNMVLFPVNNPYAPLVPADKEALADICLQNAELPYMKLFTNKKGMAQWSILSVNGEKYAVMFKGSSWTVLVKMKDPAQGDA